MQQRREQLLKELRIAEQARDLLRELEHNLSEEKGPEDAAHVRRLEQLAQSLPEAHIVRLVPFIALTALHTLALGPPMRWISARTTGSNSSPRHVRDPG